MRARHFLPFIFGCTLAVAGIHAATAADVDTQDAGTLSHTATADSSSPKGGSADLLGSRDCPPASGSSSSSTNDAASHSGSESNAAPTRRANIGWQSLLPGSIQ
ncbi:hypothetical protein [Dyella sp. GSA-30]|uniref:hypothetical protein n=1 Tax=Dyella sp. GSA-30 TaxID=2994496 RepID=UPI0024906AEB|nr:hypothetical protein [Dyella sp. GSA-30]